MQPRTLLWLIILAVAIVALSGFCLPAPSPSGELAHATREAVELARETVSRNGSAVWWSGVFRLLAIVAGVSVPLVVTYLIWRSSARGEIDAAEIIETIERYELPPPTDRRTVNPPESATPSLPVAPPDESPSSAR